MSSPAPGRPEARDQTDRLWSCWMKTLLCWEASSELGQRLPFVGTSGDLQSRSAASSIPGHAVDPPTELRFVPDT